MNIHLPPVSVKSFPEHGPVMLSSLEAQTKHLTITGSCPDHNPRTTRRGNADTAVYQRDYLTYPEVESLSAYAGYDLTS